MQSARRVSSSAAPAATAVPPHVDIVVVSDDDSLLATMREAAGAEHALWPAASADAAVDLLLNGRCGVFIADLATLGREAAALLERLHSQFPELVLLATGRREEEGHVAALVSDGRVYRFLHKPISPARAAVFLSAATRRHQELRAEQATMLSTMRTFARRPESKKFTSLAAIAVVAAVIAVTFWALRERSAGFDAGSATGDREPTAQEQVADLLGRARIAHATGRLAQPRGDNALEYYRAVLALDSTNTEAAAGINRVIAALETNVNEALQARNVRAARAALEALRGAHAHHPRLTSLQEQVAALATAQRPIAAPATESPAATDEAQTSSSPPADEQTALDASSRDADATSTEDGDAQAAAERRYQDAMEQLALAIRLRERNQLLEPSDNNAFDAVQALASQYPDIAPIRAEQRRLALRLLDAARAALADAELSQAGTFLDHAEQLVPGMAATQGLRSELGAKLREKEIAESIIPAGGLKRVREVRPQYPRDAQMRGIQGWVDIEFTIAPDGATTDLVVREAEPAGVFERSALEALRRWRFEPVMRDGSPVAQRALLRMKYALE
jgi:TonB family protein